MSPFALAVLVGGWLTWLLPFLLLPFSRALNGNNRPSKRAPQQLDRRARWGIFLQGAGFALMWYGPFWMHAVAPWRIPLAIFFFALAGLLSWTSARTLGRQWRLDAGLNADHELVRSGPYRFVRHPIYLSIIAVMLGAGFLISRPARLAAALVLEIIGTEIRIRVEDALLASRFGDKFTEYQRRVPAYIPLLR
jgi:protein-S-isoprenylcysteine O-methyltransferase Ste14